jgi:CheY-like chemotaxis protein
VLGFAKQSSGGVRIESRLGKGTAVKLYLPRAHVERVELAPSIARREAASAVQGATILRVDDDNAVREVTRAMLHNLGYRVLESGSGGAALELLAREPNLSLLMVDFAMPGMNGAERARQVQAKRPTLPILFVTGFADRTALAHVDEAHIIRKPLVEYELAGKVRLALADRTSAKVVRLRP